MDGIGVGDGQGQGCGGKRALVLESWLLVLRAQLRVLALAERVAQREAAVEDRTERPDVYAVIVGASLELLGCLCARAEHHSCLLVLAPATTNEGFAVSIALPGRGSGDEDGHGRIEGFGVGICDGAGTPGR